MNNSEILFYIIPVVVIVVIIAVTYYLIQRPINKNKEEFIVENNIDNSDSLDVINTDENKINDGYGDISSISFPKGMVVPFYYNNKSTLEYMAGWAVCDGTNGTPDLRGRFINMYNDKNQNILNYNINETGGSDETLLEKENVPAHNHTIDKNKITYRNNTASGCGGGAVGWDVNGNDQNYFQASSLSGNCTSCASSGEFSLSKEGGVDKIEPLNNSPPFFTIIFLMKL